MKKFKIHWKTIRANPASWVSSFVDATLQHGVGGFAPAFTTGPSIIGSPTVGVATSYTPGTTTGAPAPTITQQWTLDGVDIAGATGATYTPTSGNVTHLLRVREIASNGFGSANSTSAAATVMGGVPVAPAFSSTPAIIGSPLVGVASSYAPGTVTGSPTPSISQQWTLDGIDISGGTGVTYTPVIGDFGHALRVREIATNSSGTANSTSGPATVASAPGGSTFRQLGSGSLQQHMTAVRTALPEGLSAADTRMLPPSGIISFSGATIWRNKLSLGISGGHNDSYDDGHYAQDLATGLWETILLPSTVGSAAAGGPPEDVWGEWTTSGGAVGRPASQHSWNNLITIGDDIVQAYAYALSGVGSARSEQAHRWSGQAGAWSRFGTLSGTGIPNVTAAHYDFSRGRIVRFYKVENGTVLNTISATNPGNWAIVNLVAPTPSDYYGSIGYFPPLDCYVVYDSHDHLGQLWILDAANLAAGWVAVTRVGTPNPWFNGGLEYVPPMQCLASASTLEPGNIYYLKPTVTGVKTSWTWTRETFTGAAAPAAWEVGPGTVQDPYSRFRWSPYLNGFVCLKNPHDPTEVFTPSAVASTLAASEWAARSVESGVVVAYDFGTPANGGDFTWGSLKSTPHVSCFAQNLVNYPNARVIDTDIKPPGSAQSMRFDVPDGPHGIPLTFTSDRQGATSGTLVVAYPDISNTPAYFSDGTQRNVTITGGTVVTWSGALPTGAPIMVVNLAVGERGDLWWISLDDYADQFGDNAEFWIQWRTRMNASYAMFPYADSGGGLTGYKQIMIGEGMQPGELGMDPTWPYGFRGGGTSKVLNQIAGIRVDFEGETNLIGTAGVDAMTGTSAMPAVFKTPYAYHGKPTYAGLSSSDGIWFTGHNSGVESGSQAAAACRYQLDGLGVVNRASCFSYPVDEWFTLMVHIKLGARGHGLSSIPVGYQNVPATRQAPNQILLTDSDYVEHFGATISGGKFIRIRGAATGSIDAQVTAKDTVSHPGQAWLTLGGIGGTIVNEPLLVDEYENGFVNSTVEYHGAYTGRPMQLLHKRTGIVMRVGNYVYDATGYSATAKYGTFAWTTFMTSKSYTESHPTGKVWIGQIVIKSGATPPSTPAY